MNSFKTIFLLTALSLTFISCGKNDSGGGSSSSDSSTVSRLKTQGITFVRSTQYSQNSYVDTFEIRCTPKQGRNYSYYKRISLIQQFASEIQSKNSFRLAGRRYISGYSSGQYSNYGQQQAPSASQQLQAFAAGYQNYVSSLQGYNQGYNQGNYQNYNQSGYEYVGCPAGGVFGLISLQRAQ